MKHLVLIATILCFFCNPAEAFKCTSIANGPSLYWSDRSIQFVLDPQGTADIEGDSELDTLRQAFAVWNEVDCSDLNWIESDKEYDGKIGFDYLDPINNQNSLTFRDKDWPYSSLIIALTTVTANNCTGQILDADIEFNSQIFKFTNNDVVIKTDLLNTAVHEIGHMIGLDHTETINNVMYPYASSGETRCRHLFKDDIDAICFKYPKDNPPGFCFDNENGKDDCRRPESCDETVITTITPPRGCNSAEFDNCLWVIVFLIGLWLRQNYCSSIHRPHQDQV